MRNKLLVTLIIILGIFLAACNNASTSEPKPTDESEPIEIDENDTIDEHNKRVEVPDDNEEVTPDESNENTNDTPIDKKEPETKELEDDTQPKETNSKEPVKTEKKPNKQKDEAKKDQEKQQAEADKKTADAKKKADAEKKAKEKEAKEKKLAEEKAEAKKMADAAKKAEEEYNNKSIFDKVIYLTNLEREKVGVPPLEKHARLMSSAQAKSVDMNTHGMDHDSPTYGGLAGILNKFEVSYSAAGENIASGYSSAEAVVSGWMNSPDHKANMLNGNFTHIGVGYDNGYWTQQFIK